MIYLLNSILVLPLRNPVFIFAFILFIILLAPIVFNKIKIPHLIGLIILGAIIGPYSLNVLERDSSIILFGTVGLIYIMFLAGLETSLIDFIKNSRKSLVFGLLTFSIPMLIGTWASIYILNFSFISSILIASMFASNTLVTYPILIKFGVTKNRATGISVGGTIITNVFALLVLAVVVDVSKGTMNSFFWVKMGFSIILLIGIIFYIIPIIARWFFKKFDDSIIQFTFVLVVVFLSGVLSQLAGIEAIIGAFLAGIALNRLIPRTSPLMNRIGFVGNALFIPFFLIGVGMLINFRVFFIDFNTIFVAMVMTIIAISSKYFAAYLTQKIYRFSVPERQIIFGLTNSQAAATLAAVMVGYNIILGFGENQEPIRLLNESVLNGTIFMILVTCTVSSFATQKGAQSIAHQMALESSSDEKDKIKPEKILIPLSHPESIDELIQLSSILRSEKNSSLLGINIITSDTFEQDTEKLARNLLERATVSAAASDIMLQTLLRYDINAANGIVSVSKEQKITDIILGLHVKKGLTDTFLGNLTKGILTKCNAATYIYHNAQPISTIKKYHVFVPENSELEKGFFGWLAKIRNMGMNTGAQILFYGNDTSIKSIQESNMLKKLNSKFNLISNFDDFITSTNEIAKDDALVFIMARISSISYQAYLSKIPHYLNKLFSNSSFILIYPLQFEYLEYNEMDYKNPSEFEPFRKQVEQAGTWITRLGSVFNQKK